MYYLQAKHIYPSLLSSLQSLNQPWQNLFNTKKKSLIVRAGRINLNASKCSRNLAIIPFTTRYFSLVNSLRHCCVFFLFVLCKTCSHVPNHFWLSDIIRFYPDELPNSYRRYCFPFPFFLLKWLLTLARGCKSASSTPNATTSDSVILSS